MMPLRESGLRETLARAFPRRARGGLALALAVLAVLVLVDARLGESVVLAGTFVVTPFISALFGGVWATTVVAVAAVAMTALSGAWNANFGETDYDVRLAAMVLGGCVAVVGANARDASVRTMRRFELLNGVNSVADGSLPLATTVERITELLVPELADFCMIDVIREGRATRAAARAGGPRREEVEAHLSAREPHTPELLRDKGAGTTEPVVLGDIDDAFLADMATDQADLDALISWRPRSAVVFPLVARGERLGALTLGMAGWSGRSYGRQDVDFGRVLSGRVALALDNAGLFSDLESVERRMDTVMSIIDEAVILQDARGEPIYLNRAAVELFGAGSPEEALERGAAGLADAFDVYGEVGEPLPLAEQSQRRALTGEEPPPQIVRSIHRETGREIWTRNTSRAITGPDGTPLYVVTTMDDITDVKRAEFAQSLLARTGELLSSSLDHRETLQGVVSLVIPQLADWCSVNLPGRGGVIEQVAVAHRDPARLTDAHRLRDLYPVHVDEGAGLAEVLRSGATKLAAGPEELVEMDAWDARRLQLMRRMGAGSVLMIPVRAGARVVGVLALGNDAERRPFDDFDVDLASEIARRAGVAIENARLAGERTRIAERLQKGLLPPRIPEIPAWTVAAMYKPAGAENQIGGDFYDVFRTERGWMLVVGDVAGRGASAAAVTALARYTIRTGGMLTGDLVETLQLLNRALFEHEGPSLCSAAVVTLAAEAGSGRLEIVAAGHPPPLIVRGDSVGEVDCAGPLLGAFDDPAWSSSTAELSMGDQLVLYTDGVIEARGGKERFGLERLRSELASSKAPGVAISRVETALHGFAGSDLEDDAAVVVLQRAAAVRDRTEPARRAVGAGA